MAMKVKRTRFPGIYHCPNSQDFVEVEQWMKQTDVEYFMLQMGYGGYVFQVKSNHDWFVLRWL
jgi:hypothetical protein